MAYGSTPYVPQKNGGHIKYLDNRLYNVINGWRVYGECCYHSILIIACKQHMTYMLCKSCDQQVHFKATVIILNLAPACLQRLVVCNSCMQERHVTVLSESCNRVASGCTPIFKSIVGMRLNKTTHAQFNLPGLHYLDMVTLPSEMWRRTIEPCCEY